MKKVKHNFKFKDNSEIFYNSAKPFRIKPFLRLSISEVQNKLKISADQGFLQHSLIMQGLHSEFQMMGANHLMSLIHSKTIKFSFFLKVLGKLTGANQGF